jgi:hypothetical protein
LGENSLRKLLVEQFFHLSLCDLKHNHLIGYYDTECSTEYIDVTIVIQLYDAFVVVGLDDDDDDDDNKDKALNNLSG